MAGAAARWKRDAVRLVQLPGRLVEGIAMDRVGAEVGDQDMPAAGRIDRVGHDHVSVRAFLPFGVRSRAAVLHHRRPLTQ